MKSTNAVRPTKSIRKQPHRHRLIVENKPVLGRDLHEALLHFMEYHPAKRLSRNLRTMLIDFLMYEGAVEVNYLEDLLYDLQALFELLEAIQSDKEGAGQDTV